MRFTVEWRRPFCWRVRAEHKYHGIWIGDFWTEGGARAVADRLNQYMEDRPTIEANEAQYDREIAEERIGFKFNCSA